MEKTFRQKIITYFTDVAKKNRLLKYPSLAGMSVALFFYYIGMHFLMNGKRYASMPVSYTHLTLPTIYSV